jgi:hypothetical protein
MLDQPFERWAEQRRPRQITEHPGSGGSR